MFARNLANPINQLIASFGLIVLMMVSAARIFDVLDQKEEVERPEAKSSDAPILVKILSISPITALFAGTNEPIRARMQIKAH